MRSQSPSMLLCAVLTAIAAAPTANFADGQELPAPAAVPASSPPAVVHLTLAEAKQRALSSSKLLSLAAMNAHSKAFAIKAMRADYFPKISANALFVHFSDDLGSVLTINGRARQLLGFPPFTASVAVLDQNSAYVNVGAVQPITDLLKVRQGVRIAQADAGIAQAELEKGTRELISGVEQLYWGLLAARKIQAGANEALQGAQTLVKVVPKKGSLEAHIALVEARQGVQAIDKQVADVQEQLDALLGLPLCTTLDLEEPPLPVLPFHCADDAVSLALANSPDIRSAQQTICKAEAALKAGKLDYMPSIGAVGGYLNQQFADYIQPNIGYVGVVGSWTLVDWGKRRNVVRERRCLVEMATVKLRQTQDEVRQKAVKLFREVAEAEDALKTAQEMAQLRKEAAQKATTPEAMGNPAALEKLLKATTDAATAGVDLIKADLTYRSAFVQLMSLVGQQQ